MVEVLFDYFGGKLSISAIQENFITVYQILDEMLDNGYPLMTEQNVLKEMVKPKTSMSRLVDNLSIAGNAASKSSGLLPEAAESSVPWRKAVSVTPLPVRHTVYIHETPIAGLHVSWENARCAGREVWYQRGIL